MEMGWVLKVEITKISVLIYIKDNGLSKLLGSILNTKDV